jgi:hypothetical protein
MLSRIEPDRYAGTGFAVKDTAPEINAMIFAAMMRKTPVERLLMGFDMMATGPAVGLKRDRLRGNRGRKTPPDFPTVLRHGLPVATVNDNLYSHQKTAAMNSLQGGSERYARHK